MRNYERLISFVIAKGIDPGVYEVEVLHDDGCRAINNGGECRCDCLAFVPHPGGLLEIGFVDGVAKVLSVDGVPAKEFN